MRTASSLQPASASTVSKRDSRIQPAGHRLHFALFERGPGREWWKGTPVNPYPLFLGGQR